jgi:hypothetical protein
MRMMSLSASGRSAAAIQVGTFLYSAGYTDFPLSDM